MGEPEILLSICFIILAVNLELVERSILFSNEILIVVSVTVATVIYSVQDAYLVKYLSL